MNDHDTRFDDAMRGLHRQALGSITPATRQRLRDARTGTTRRAHGGAWALGAGLAAVVALAIGLQLRPPQAPPASPASLAADTAASSADATHEPAVATLDENPDLYLWLASNGADLVALEN